MDYSNDYPAWDYSEADIAQKFLFFNVLKDGRIHVLAPEEPNTMKIPPSDDPTTGVKIKDVKVSSEVTVRMFLPPAPSGKLPVLLYVHGGAFCMGSAFSVAYTRFLTTLVAQSNILAVSVEYGLFPERSISACYDDSWLALQWVASHVDAGQISGESINSALGPRDPWISDHGDLKRIFIGGDSAGGNISHTLLTRVAKMGLPEETKVEGMILVHPYFAEDDKMWLYMCPINEGPKDPRMKPATEDLAKIKCDRVLVLLAEKDFIRHAGVMYVEELRKSGWKGTMEIAESKDKEHCFHLGDYLDEEALIIK